MKLKLRTQISKLKLITPKLFSNSNLLILLIFSVGIFLRAYQLPERFLYGHDQDLASWFVKDVLVNKHLRLIGQETSTAGIFIGSAFYYLMTIFYKIFGNDPIGGAYLILTLSFFGMLSVYFVITKIFGKTTAVFALMIYCFSNYLIFNDREVVPTMPVIIWSIWFIYCLHRILNKEWLKGLLLASLLAALIWHLNFALILVFPLVPLAMFLSKNKFDIKPIAVSAISFVILTIPLIVFEIRHGFSQTHALISSLTTSQNDVVSGYEKYQRVFYLLSKNLHGLIIGAYPGIKFQWVMYGFMLLFVTLVIKKAINKNWSIIFSVWVLTFFIFFSSYSKIVSEYYLNGSLIVFLTIISVGLAKMFGSVKFRHLSIIAILLITVFGIRNFALTPINKSGYKERKEIIAEIIRDAEVHNFTCVSISYITDAGYNLGYRYFIYFLGLKTKPISEFVPVYTIVFPLKPIFPTDKTKGAIGLIFPDYDKYDQNLINEKCDGVDYNLTEPMWGFPQ